MKALTTFAGIKKGQKFMVIKNTSNHNYELGKVYTFSKDGIAAQSMTAIAVGAKSYNTIGISEIELCDVKLVDLKAELAVLLAEKEKEVTELTRKIKFCEDNKLEEYDVEVEKIYSILKTLQGKKSNMQKAKAINDLIKQ